MDNETYRGLTDVGLRSKLKWEAQKAGSQSELAKQIGVSVQYLNNIILGKCVPGPKVLRFMNKRKIVLYIEKIGEHI